MKKLLKEGGIVNKAMWYLYYLIILNVLWVGCSIPLITIGASTTSLFYVSGKMIRGESVKPVQDFFKSFKSNFKESTIVWLILAAVYSAVIINIYFFSGQNIAWSNAIMIIQFPVLAVLIMTTVFIFPILSRFEIGVKQLFKVSFILGIRYFIPCLLCIGIVVLGVLLVKLIPAFILIMLASVIAFAIYGVLNRILEKYSPCEEAAL